MGARRRCAYRSGLSGALQDDLGVGGVYACVGGFCLTLTASHYWRGNGSQ